jgi:hypothetical protein
MILRSLYGLHLWIRTVEDLIPTNLINSLLVIQAREASPDAAVSKEKEGRRDEKVKAEEVAHGTEQTASGNKLLQGTIGSYWCRCNPSHDSGDAETDRRDHSFQPRANVQIAGENRREHEDEFVILESILVKISNTLSLALSS